MSALSVLARNRRGCNAGSGLVRHAAPLAVGVILCLGLATGLSAADPPTPSPDTPLSKLPDMPDGFSEAIPLPTAGGKQFWDDQLHFHKWRIQRNVVTGHCRLLDEQNLRHAWGSFEACRQKLDEIRAQRRLPPMKGRVVIVLHGLLRSRAAMDKLCEALEQEGKFQVLNVEYASTHGTIADHAQSLAQIVDHLGDVEEIHFVGHSMGNIVIRRFLFDRLDPTTGQATDRRFKRMVMIGPPNHGSQLAELLTGQGLLKKVDHLPGKELGDGWAELAPKLAVPPFEFAVIAGGRGDDKGFNPALPGDDDGIVSVETARLAGAADYCRVPVRHSALVSDPAVAKQAARFLQSGFLVDARRRQPIAKGS